MDLENQKRVLNLTEEHGAENIVVVLGAAEGEAAGLAAETVTAGDPTFAGPLTGVQLGLSVFHVCEPQIKDEVDAGVYDEQVGMMEMGMDVEDIISEMSSIRDEFCKYHYSVFYRDIFGGVTSNRQAVFSYMLFIICRKFVLLGKKLERKTIAQQVAQ